MFVLLGTWVTGDVVRSRLARADRVVGAARTLVAQREAVASAALADERASIARELHDVIAHSVSVMGVQAGAARSLMDTDRAAARSALHNIESTARASVAELQRLLAVLRDGSTTPGLTPQPGLAQLPELVDDIRAAGVPVALAVSYIAKPLSPGVDLAAYRIIQEALTNSLKHSRTPTTVEVSQAAGQAHRRPRCGAGRGHASERRRARARGHARTRHLYGGTRQAAPHPEAASIAGALFVSPGTVKTHVGRILAKLDLRDRVQAVVFAYETALTRPGSR